MFAKIGKGTSIHRTLDYNEIKVKQGKAEFLASENFLKPGHLLTREDKIDRFLQRNTLYQGKSAPMVPISISFDVDEKISQEKMEQVVQRYMSGIGFDRQPYLVYRHYDTGHPHCHIVTTAVSREGEFIYLSPGTLRKSHQLCRTIEQESSLHQ